MIPLISMCQTTGLAQRLYLTMVVRMWTSICNDCALCMTLMRSDKHVTFDEASNTHYDITGYSEVCHANPHTISSTATGWKSNPGRADLFTSKSSTVMKARRKKYSGFNEAPSR